MNKYFQIPIWLVIFFISNSCTKKPTGRIIQNFNFNWDFYYADTVSSDSIDKVEWLKVQLPHDYSIEQGYSEPINVESEIGQSSENNNNLPSGVERKKYNGYTRTASSTGFVPGGIGWYKKSFFVPSEDSLREVFIEFDGIYCNSRVWVNGHLLGFRPNGYVGFSYNLTSHLNYGTYNTIIVKVDHSNYVDQRWYAGSGIYRDVKLVKKSKVYIPQWATKITTGYVTDYKAELNVYTKLKTKLCSSKIVDVEVIVTSSTNDIIANTKKMIRVRDVEDMKLSLEIDSPKLWNVDEPNIYKAEIRVISDGDIIDNCFQTFGIRYYEFKPDSGFFLNGEHVKIKGVNLHQDAGNLGIAVPKEVWRYRLHNLKQMGCNAVRTAHHPFSTNFYDVCDELGILVMSEFFDEWMRPKSKSISELGANDALPQFSSNYTEYFNQWAEQDIKDCIKRDFNHPSIIMWSIGNEIEWTFGYYSRAYGIVNGKQDYYDYEPNYDSVVNREAYKSVKPEVDSLIYFASNLNKWVKEEDTTRLTTIGSVMPVVGMVSGLAQVVDVFGFNYRACEYSGAHKEYPNVKILGSENWGSWKEWRSVIERDYVAGIFVWTGMAYLGEAGPFPRKGLNISFFDFAGFKTPRGHFYECLWNNTPKVYVGTTKLS